MKQIIIILAMVFSVSISAQRQVEQSVTLKSNQEIFLDFKFAENIKVENWNKNELLVKVSVNIDDGEGNDSFSLQTEENSGLVEMKSDFGDYFKNKNKKDRNYWDSRNSTTNIIYTVYVPADSNLKIKSISGDVTINEYKGFLKTDLISGDVTIKNYDGELHLKTISGDVDVTFNKADVSAKTLTGTIYANLDIDLEGGKRSGGQNNIKGKINSGGTLVKMETISGDIFLRKS